MTERPSWTPDRQALELLESHGGPFESKRFRDSLLAAMPDCRDASYGAVAPDGTAAAIALIYRRRSADSVPPSGYGGIQSSRALSAAEAQAFLGVARRGARAASLTARGVQFGDPPAGAQQFTTASVVNVSEGATYSRLARRSLRRAEAAGAWVSRSNDPGPFLQLYETASVRWAVQYPKALIEQLASSGAGVFHHVSVDREVVSSLLTLVGGSHWMCWLAAQNDVGRAVAASYAAYDAVFDDARAAVSQVNLGASAPGSGGRQFKSYLGAHEVPMVAWQDSAIGWRPVHTALGLLRRGAQPVRRRLQFS